MATQITCPSCKKQLEYNPQNSYRPFCCKRCKEIDLAAWANEDYRVPSEEGPADDESSPARLEDEED